MAVVGSVLLSNGADSKPLRKTSRGYSNAFVSARRTCGGLTTAVSNVTRTDSPHGSTTTSTHSVRLAKLRLVSRVWHRRGTTVLFRGTRSGWEGQQGCDRGCRSDLRARDLRRVVLLLGSRSARSGSTSGRSSPKRSSGRRSVYGGVHGATRVTGDRHLRVFVDEPRQLLLPIVRTCSGRFRLHQSR